MVQIWSQLKSPAHCLLALAYRQIWQVIISAFWISCCYRTHYMCMHSTSRPWTFTEKLKRHPRSLGGGVMPLSNTKTDISMLRQSHGHPQLENLTGLSLQSSCPALSRDNHTTGTIKKASIYWPLTVYRGHVIYIYILCIHNLSIRTKTLWGSHLATIS